MKRFLPLLLGALLALPLLADDPPADDDPVQETPEVRQEPAAPPVPQDSPLVAAAKRNGRGRMPARIITNATVKASKGHLTTTKTQRPIDLAAMPKTPEAKPKAKAKPASKKPADARAGEKREEEQAATAAAAEEGMYDGVEDDPATAEHAAEEAQKPPR